MNVILYPLHLWRKFERRWTARIAQDESQGAVRLGSEGCNACGRVVEAPVHATYLPVSGVVYQWRCPECQNSWQTSVDPTISTDSQSGRSEHLRENAGHCPTPEDAAPDAAARGQFRHTSDSWLALAETPG